MKPELKGEISILFSSVFFCAVPIFAKLISDTVDGYFMAFVRFIIGILLGVVVLKFSGQKFEINNKRYWIMRGFFGSIAMITYFVSVAMTSSGRATLLMNTHPIFVALFGFMFFKERISLNHILSILVCVVGVLFVFYDGSKYPLIGDLFGIICALSAGVAVHYIKKARQANHPVMVYLAACTFGLLFTSFSAPQVMALNWFVLILIVSMGVLSFLGQVAMTYGFRYVSASKGSIYTYSIIPLTIGASYFIGEEFRLNFFIGAALIIVGLLINRRKESVVNR